MIHSEPTVPILRSPEVTPARFSGCQGASELVQMMNEGSDAP